MDCSLPAFSVHRILQARILEWVAMPSSRGSSRPRNQTRDSCIAGGFSTTWAMREAPKIAMPHVKRNNRSQGNCYRSTEPEESWHAECSSQSGDWLKTTQDAEPTGKADACAVSASDQRSVSGVTRVTVGIQENVIWVVCIFQVFSGEMSFMRSVTDFQHSKKRKSKYSETVTTGESE